MFLRYNAIREKRMNTDLTLPRPFRAGRLVVVLAVVALAACSSPPPSGFNDPFEAQNRATHEANKDLDRTVIRPVSQAYGKTVPSPVRRSVNNFADNLDLPGIVLNDLFQFKLENAVWNASRFLFNTTVGIAGLFDPAATIGLSERDNDFGRTLYAWGVPEGNYVELPVLGPSTERRTVGMVVDFVLNPVRLAIEDADAVNALGAGTGVASVADTRFRFSDTIDGVLYESADSYAQARMMYLQRRRAELGIDPSGSYVDLYEVYGQDDDDDER